MSAGGCAPVADQQVDDLILSGEHRVLDDRLLRIGIHGVGIRPVVEQPLGATWMVWHGVAEQVVHFARAIHPAGRPGCPFARFAPLVRFRPKQVEPEGRILTKRRVVKRLQIEWIGAARDQHAGKRLRLRVSGLLALAAADDSGQRREFVFAVGP